jgi:indole-3-acetate monooxygenase
LASRRRARSESASARTFGTMDLPSNQIAAPKQCRLFPWALAAVTVGVARAAIDAFVELAAIRTPASSQTLLRDKPVAQSAVGRADAMLRAARAGLIEAVETQWREVAAGRISSLAERAGVRLATIFAGEACVRAIELVYNAAGGSAILESGRLDRCSATPGSRCSIPA